MSSSNRDALFAFVENGNIRDEDIDEVLKEANIVPTLQEWHSFVDRLLLWIGVVSLALCVIFFMAYNWNELGRFAKFAIVEASMIVAIGAYWYLGGEKLSAKASLMGAVILLGSLLALIGQTYQTGADPWQLFALWAVLMLPWAFIARFSAIWIFWIVIANIAIQLYSDAYGFGNSVQFHRDNNLLLVLSAFNTVAFIIWELLRNRFEWLNEKWAIRLLGAIVIYFITFLALKTIFGYGSFIFIIVWLLAISAIYWLYRVRDIDLLMLTIGAISIGTIFISAMIKAMPHSDLAIIFILFMAIVIIALSAAFISWIKKIQKEESYE